MKELAKHLIRQGYLYVGGEKTIEAIEVSKSYRNRKEVKVFKMKDSIESDWIRSEERRVGKEC